MITIIEDVIPKEYQDHLHRLLDGDLPLYYNAATCVIGDDIRPDANTKEVPQYTHTFIRDGNTNSDAWKMFEPITYGLMAKAGIGIEMKLIQVKLNFNPQDITFSEHQYFMPHVDRTTDKGITAIYYMNDCDGDTLFFDDNGNIMERFTPKKGSIVYFNNRIYHAGKPPRTSPYRSIINFNWVE